MKRFFLTVFLLCISVAVRAQGFQNTGVLGLYFASNKTDVTKTLQLYVPTLASSLVWKLPVNNGSANQVLITDGASPATLSWASVSGLIHAVLYDPASSGTQIIQSTSNSVVDLTLKKKVGSSQDLFDIVDASNNPYLQVFWDGSVEITPAVTGTAFAVDAALGTTEIAQFFSATTIQSYLEYGGTWHGVIFNADPGLAATVGFQYNSAAPSGHYLRGNGTTYIDGTIQIGDLPSLAGSYIQNQYTAQTSAGFYITAGAPAKTSNFIETRISNNATSSTNGVNMYGLYIETKGTNSGLVAQNNGIAFDVSGGTTNYDLVGTSGHWNIASSGDATLNSIASLLSPLANTYGGTGIDASAVTDGQLLIGQTSGHSFGLATITAGTGVTVTNAGHSITIAAAGALKVYHIGPIDMSILGNTTFTITTGATNNFAPMHYLLRGDPNVTGVTVNGSVSIGITPINYTDRLPATNPPNTANGVMIRTPADNTNTFGNGATFTCRVNPASTLGLGGQQNIYIDIVGIEY